MSCLYAINENDDSRRKKYSTANKDDAETCIFCPQVNLLTSYTLAIILTNFESIIPNLTGMPLYSYYIHAKQSLAE